MLTPSKAAKLEDEHETAKKRTSTDHYPSTEVKPEYFNVAQTIARKGITEI